MTETKMIPVLNKASEANYKENPACSTCGKGGCCSGFGITAGSEKEVVYRNVFLYLSMGAIIFGATYLSILFH
ncbi:hypothetical protein RE474_10520 [Methanolobus sediminis]|uniref:Uncharacterized protein n=1 Tax=Methanolobus sediminis TaxID=3072978 RepID=A0AA51UJH3_9EURY|nr:hypothetical protein [Methanolobus sediminis]WMW24514.1 hypothetical protein RE474_10520 [Methanolobus sediminis]